MKIYVVKFNIWMTRKQKKNHSPVNIEDKTMENFQIFSFNFPPSFVRKENNGRSMIRHVITTNSGRNTICIHRRRPPMTSWKTIT